MKKVILILITLLLLTGCSTDNVMQSNYRKYMKNLASINEDSSYIPCDVQIKYDKITDDEVMYQVILDNPKENMRNINVIVSHNMETKDGYPSIGVFDIEPINLMHERDIDNTNKGIVLVGYFKYSGDLEIFKGQVEFKVSINYINDSIEEKTVYLVETL